MSGSGKLAYTACSVARISPRVAKARTVSSMGGTRVPSAQASSPRRPSRLHLGAIAARRQARRSSCLRAASPPAFRTAIGVSPSTNSRRTDHGAVYDTADRPSSFAGYSLTWDDAGRLTSKSGNGVDESFYWSPMGRLDSIADGDTVWRYEYDGFGRRVERGKTGYVLHFLWDGSSLFAVYAGATALKATYAYFPGGALPHSLRADEETYYLATDDLGSVLGLFGDSGVANDYRYDPWGNAQHGSTTVSNWLRWAGSMLDWHEGLYAMGARSYDPELGRFLSEDPLGLSAGINPYAYVGNSPTNGTDPSGLDCYFTWTPDPWCDDATELKVLVQGGGGGAGAAGGYGASSAPGLGGDGDGAGPNSGFAAFGPPGGGAAAAARADTFNCQFNASFLEQAGNLYRRSWLNRQEFGGWYGAPWSDPLHVTVSGRPGGDTVHVPFYAGASGDFHTHWGGGAPSLRDTCTTKTRHTTHIIISGLLYVYTPIDSSWTTCSWPQ